MDFLLARFNLASVFCFMADAGRAGLRNAASSMSVAVRWNFLLDRPSAKEVLIKYWVNGYGPH